MKVVRFFSINLFTLIFVFVCCRGSLGYSRVLEGLSQTQNLETLPINESEGDAIHLTQIRHSTYNPDGPYSSNNCGPASFAMCLRALGYFGYGNTARLIPEEQVDHARALMYYISTTIIRQGITYGQLDLDDALTDVDTYCPGAIAGLGGDSMDVETREDLDKALDNGMPVILYGWLTDTWKSKFYGYPYGHWSGTGYHYVAVTGKTYYGDYIVNDPLHKYGAELMTFSELYTFQNTGDGVDGMAFFWRTPTPCAIKKSNGSVYVFMRDSSDGYIYRTYQYYANGPFSNWGPISYTQTCGNPVVIEQPNGLLLLFVRGTNGQILMFSEDIYGNMSNMTDFGGLTYYEFAVCKNQDGRVEYYVRGVDGKICKRYQTSVNGGFSNWDTVSGGGNSRTGATATLNYDGRIEVFVGYKSGSSTPLGHTWQSTPNGGWAGYWSTSLGGHCKNIPTAFRHGDGASGDQYIRVFVRGSDNTLYYRTQRDGWVNWYSTGSSYKTIFGRPAVAMVTYTSGGYQYSDMQVFVRGVDNVIHWTRQEKRGSAYNWSSWNDNIEGIATSDPAVARYSNGGIFVTVRGTDGNMWYRVQSNDQGDWANWTILGNSRDFR